jgi:hypothetical protein
MCSSSPSQGWLASATAGSGEPRQLGRMTLTPARASSSGSNTDTSDGCASDFCALLTPEEKVSRSLLTSSGQAGYPGTGSGSLTPMSPLATSAPAVTRPAGLTWMILASRIFLGAMAHITIRVANIFQDLLLPGTTRFCLMGQVGRKILAGQLGLGQVPARSRPGPSPGPGLPRGPGQDQSTGARGCQEPEHSRPRSYATPSIRGLATRDAVHGRLNVTYVARGFSCDRPGLVSRQPAAVTAC